MVNAKYPGYKPVSAGFVVVQEGGDKIYAYGHSESLKLNSTDEDTIDLKIVLMER